MKVLCHAFDITLKEFGIKAKDLSQTAQVSTGTISNFRNDLCSVTTDSLERLLESLPEEAFIFWLSQVACARGIEEFIQDPIALKGFINKLEDDNAVAELLIALAKRVREGNPLAPVSIKPIQMVAEKRRSS